MCFFCWNQSPFCCCGPSHHAVSLSFSLDEPFESKGCTLCPQILQHPYKRCLLNVEWLHGWMKSKQAQENGPLAWKGSIGVKPRWKMANETHDNTWYLGSTLLPSWIFVSCVKRNCASTASNWLGREGGAVYTQIHCGWEDSWTPAEE